jgi:hypothetical protein
MDLPNSTPQVQDIYKGQRSQLILVIGESGRGKSTSLENLPAESTYLINVLGKPLPFMGGFVKYTPEKNLSVVAEPSLIISKMEDIARNKPHIKQIVIDDGTYIMTTDFVQKALIKGYDKWSIMAKNIWDILRVAANLRGDLKIFFLGHEEDENGVRRMLTLGKMLRANVNPDGMSAIVLFAETKIVENKRSYYFAAQTDGQTTAHTPRGMFPDFFPNDLNLVVKRIDEYYSGIKLEDSKLDFGTIIQPKGGG